MNKTLIQGLTEKDVQAIINTYNLHDFYYPTLFPLKETATLTWKMLQGQAGLRIAADLVARGSRLPKKTREAIARIQGDIPKIAISRDKDEDALTDYDIMLAMAGNNPDLKAIVEFWAEDTQFCWNAVAARAEWLALQQISLGKVTMTNANNNSVVTEFDVDYAMPSTQKIGVNTVYAAYAGKPFTKDIPAAIKAGKDIGVTFKYMFMNSDTLALFAQQEETIKTCASYLSNLAAMAQAPDLDAINQTLAKKIAFKGIQIIEVDQEITIEKADGTRTTTNPFANNVILFSESKVLGTTMWKKPIDMNLTGSPAIKVMNGHTLIKKYSEEDPVKEVTSGIANLFPVWNLSDRSLLMNVDATTWTK